MEVVELETKLTQLQDDFDLFKRQVDKRLSDLYQMMSNQDVLNRKIIDAQGKQINDLLLEAAELRRNIRDLKN